LSDDRVSYARVRKQASGLLADQQTAPVDLKPILEKLAIELREMDLPDDVSGILLRDGDRKVVVVNAKHPGHRQRFTIAHEIGHLVLHPGQDVHVDDGFRINLRDGRSASADDVEEVEANAFAANLLMPLEWVRSAMRSDSIDFNDDSEIRRLADQFKVSTQAMLIRLTTLGAR
jgi:Zn-dependent peptidase ImmA (M78 family)